jgi:hypothetical protein
MVEVETVLEGEQDKIKGRDWLADSDWYSDPVTRQEVPLTKGTAVKSFRFGQVRPLDGHSLAGVKSALSPPSGTAAATTLVGDESGTDLDNISGGGLASAVEFAAEAGDESRAISGEEFETLPPADVGACCYWIVVQPWAFLECWDGRLAHVLHLQVVAAPHLHFDHVHPH